MPSTILIIPIFISFAVTIFLIPNWIKKAKEGGIQGRDIQKSYKVEVAEAGGITVLAGFILGSLFYIAINTFVFNSTNNFIKIFSLLFVVTLVSFIGFIDDILGWKIGLRRRLRIILVAFAAIPLMAINAGRSEIALPLLGSMDIGIIYPLIFIPVGIVGASVTFNFLAGFNGLEAGQGILLLTAMAIVSFYTGNSWLSLIAVIMIASLLAFLIFNFFPAKIFPGDSLTYAVGSLIPVIAILGNFEKVAVFFFVPYIIEFVLKARGGLKKESFGKANKDGSLDLRYDKIYGLTHFSIYSMKKFGIKPTEKKVVYSIWAFQLIIILIGFIIFREGIFFR